MNQAGLDEVQGQEHAAIAAGGTPALLYYDSLIAQVEQPLLDVGLTEYELRRFHELMIDPEFSAWSYQFVFTWDVGQRPDSPVKL